MNLYPLVFRKGNLYKKIRIIIVEAVNDSSKHNFFEDVIYEKKIKLINNTDFFYKRVIYFKPHF